MIFSGPVGIGKATFAYRLARFLLSQGAEGQGGLFGGEQAPHESFNADEEGGVVRRVASGGHADLLTVGRVFDTKKSKLSNQIPVDEVRRVAPFLRRTSSEGGWRIVIVDDAQYLNRSSQNALLKILEEPPAKALLVLITDQPGRFLPTIRSRCQTYTFNGLSENHIDTLLQRFSPQTDQASQTLAKSLGQGQIGRILKVLQNDGVSVYRDVFDLLSRLPAVDGEWGYNLSETLGADEKAYRLYMEFLLDILRAFVRYQALGAFPPSVDEKDLDIYQKMSHLHSRDVWLRIWEKAVQIVEETERMHLDKKQAVLNIIWTLENK